MHLNSTNTFHKMEIENEATGTHLKIIVFLNRISHITTCITLADYYHIPTEHRLHHRVGGRQVKQVNHQKLSISTHARASVKTKKLFSKECKPQGIYSAVF